MTAPGTTGATRRQFVLGGLTTGLLVGCAGARGIDMELRPGAWLDGWVHVGVDGKITIECGRSELGQGTFTGIATLVAEELDCDPAKIRVVTGPVADRFFNIEAVLNIFHPNGGFAKAPGEGDFGDLVFGGVGKLAGKQLTGGSSSMTEHFDSAREAGATMREWLVATAMAEWGATREECRTTGFGAVTRGNASKTYGELARIAATRPPPKEMRPRPREYWRLVGVSDRDARNRRPVQRLDIPAKVDGSAKFGIDMRLDEPMLFAAVRNSPVFGGQVVDIDQTKLKTLKYRDRVEVHRLDGAVAVTAESTWHAEHALRQLDIKWDNGAVELLSTDEIWNILTGALARKFERLPGAHEYRLPYLAHATMEPMNCTAKVGDGGVDVWVSTQNQSDARKIAAETAKVAEDKVQIHTLLAGGGFGRRLEVDLVKQAVRLAMLANKPVQVVWSREEDLQHDYYRPAAIVRIAGTLDGKKLVATRHQIASQSIIARVYPAATLWRPDQSMVEGASDMPYDIREQRVESVPVELPIPVGYWRSVGHSITGFANESFIDEMAHAVPCDPVEFRLNMLAAEPPRPGEPEPKRLRLARLLKLVTDKARWAWTDRARTDGRGQGVAMHLSFGSAVAMVAQVTLDRRRLKLERIIAAIDCGTAINPDIVKAQIEGSIVFGLSAALFGKITIEAGRVVQRNFPDYELMRLYQMPTIDVEVVESKEAPGGAGEPGVPPVAPALANAIYAASGRKIRIRALPIVDQGLTI